ncbi:MAG TPA: hypothetical protein VIL18_12330 [Longimicrobiales bacterium]
MRHESPGIRGIGGSAALLLLLSLVVAMPGAAQTRRHLVPPGPPAPSPFDLAALGDLGVSGISSSARWGMCFSNLGVSAPRDLGCGDLFGQGTAIPAGGTPWLIAEIPFYVAAGPTDLPPQINQQALIGGGYTVNRTSGLPRYRKLMPSDRSGRELLNAGVLTTADGGCRDYRAVTRGNVRAGVQMLPNLTCPETHPATGFAGARLIREEGYAAFAATPEGARDPFAFWRVPADLQSEKFLGNEQVYGEFADWTSDLLAQYGAALPGGQGPSSLRGYPLGITVFANAYYFTLPTISNTFFWRATVVNESYKLYGDGVDPSTGVDYDSLYMGINPVIILGAQFHTQFLDPKRNAVLMYYCSQRAVTNGAKPTPFYGPATDCPTRFATSNGFHYGAMAIIVLRSPLGDTRNKLLSDPESPFYNPTHPEADDTLTINQLSGCGFISCTTPVHDRSDRAYFGLLSGRIDDLLDGRAPNELADGDYFNIVGNADWPNRGPFNVWVPTNWDYNDDGVDDEVRAHTCLGTGPNGCAAVWSDTVPGGFVNGVGQFPHIGVGPIRLRSGDTTSFVIAFTWEADSASIETQVNNVIDFYNDFYFGPEEVPPPNVYAVGSGRVSTVATTAGSINDAQVTLLWDDLSDYRDEFIADLVQRVEEAPVGTPFGNIRALNPWIVDSLRARVENNLVALYVFKSCTGGTTFTDDSDCFPDRVPTADQTSKWSVFGWLPYATLDPSEGRFVDDDVQPGLTLFYSLVTESRGAVFDVYTGSTVVEDPPGSGRYICVSSDCGVQEFVFSPPILSALKTTPGGSAVSVYVPASRQAGFSAATAELELPTDRVLVPVTITLTDDAPDGQYTGVFGDSVEVIEVERVRGGESLGFSTTATVFRIRDVYDPGAAAVARRVIRTETLSGNTQFSERGASSVETETSLAGDTTVVTRTIRFSGLTLLLARDGGGPVLGTSSLRSGATTPGGFLSSRDFGGFILDVHLDSATAYRGHTVTTPDGEVLPNDLTDTEPVRWLQTTATNLAGFYGQYEIEWADHPFGPAREFRTDRGADPTDAFLASLAARNDPRRSLANDQARQLLAAAGINVAELREYSLPFTIRNLNTGQTVDVVVIDHPQTIRIGVGADTVRISVPTDRWMPGDELVLIEPLPRDSMVNDGVVLDGDGNPIRVTHTVASWRVRLGCDAAVQGFQCNPVVAENYLTLAPGTRDVVTYISPLDADARFGLTVTGRRFASTGGTSGRVDLSAVKVVPNPYIMFSTYERRENDRIIKFTNLPPRGTISIYTVAGQLVQRITYDEADLEGGSGDLSWNMRTFENTEIAYGLYVFVLESEFGRKAGKFVVIR